MGLPAWDAIFADSWNSTGAEYDAGRSFKCPRATVPPDYGVRPELKEGISGILNVDPSTG